MVLLSPVQLTPSGRPVLGPGEYEVTTLDKVDLEFDGAGGLVAHQEQAYKGGYVVLTNSRLIWQPPAQQQPPSCSLPVPGIMACTRKSQLGLTGMKLRVVLTCSLDAAGQVVPASLGYRSGTLSLRCRGDAPDTLMTQLEALIAHAARSPSPQAQATSPSPRAPGPAASSGQLAGQAQHMRSMPAGSGAGAGQAQPVGGPLINPSMLQQMVDMGFPYWRSARALAATHSSSVQAAVDHLLEMGDHMPDADTPFDLHHPPASIPPGQQQQAGGVGQPSYQQRSYVRPAGTLGYQAQGGPATQVQQPPMSFPVGPIGPLRAGLQAMSSRPPAAPSGQQAGQAGPYSGCSGYLQPQVLPAQGSDYLQAGGGGGGGAGSDALSWAGSMSQHYDAGSEWGSAAGSQGGAVGGPALSYSNPGGANTLGNPLLDQLNASINAHSQAGGPGGMPASSSWPHLTPPTASGFQPASASAGGGSVTVGVSGLVLREAARRTEAAKALDSAFQDLHALMGMAADMVKLAERFRTVATAQGELQSGADDVLDADTAAQLAALGIASPVTRATAGSRYQVELARQLADWLLGAQVQPPGPGPLARAGGLMPLTDVYCLFNRARGSELVSPDDLLAACKLLGQVGTPLSLRQLSSGMLAVQGAEFSDERVCARIAGMVDPSTASASDAQPMAVVSGLGAAVSASDVAHVLGCSTSLAAEYLLLAESRGVVCRDDGPQGLRFFRNFFKDAGLAQLLVC